METFGKEFKQVPAHNVHTSNVLPTRGPYDMRLPASVREEGIQQPLIVRPDPKNPGTYEVIDGSGRLACMKPDDILTIDVRQDLKDSDVFKISNATFRRKARSIYDMSRFISCWIETLTKEGTGKGVQAVVAKHANISESMVSQCVTIHRMFQVLESLPETKLLDFDALKKQSINKLHELSRLTDNPSGLIESAKQLSDSPDMSLEKLQKITRAQDKETDFLDEFDTPREEDLKEREEWTYSKAVEVVAETVAVAEEARKKLVTFETRVKSVDAKSLNSDILNILPKLQKRFRRLERDVTKLEGYITQTG